MDRIIAKQMNEEFSKMMEDFAKKYGLTAQGSRLSYNDFSCEFKIKLAKADESGVRVANENMESHAQWDLVKKGIKYSGKIMGNKFNINRLGECEIIDFNTRAKYNFVVRTNRGETYRVTANQIKWN